MPKKKEKNPTFEALRKACVSERAAVEFMESRRWRGEAWCPYCMGTDVYAMKDRKTGDRNKNYRWRCRTCSKQFSVRTGTVMEESRLSLTHWCYAFWKACASKKGVSALQISRERQISYKSALFLMHRIRHAMQQPDNPQPMTGDVEVDEAYIGGKPYKHHRKPTKNTVKPKQTVLAMVNREDGQVRVRHPQGRVGAAEIGAVLVNNIHRNSRLFTDGSALYKWAKGYFNDHKWVDHSAREYSRREGMDVVTTNTIEGFFSLLKRGVYGTFHSISREHLQLYLSEFEFRYNTRHDDDGERTEAAIRSSVGKRLRYDDHVVRKKAG